MTEPMRETVDYVSPGFEVLDPFPHFPYVLRGFPRNRFVVPTDCPDPHAWYFDRRVGATGLVNVDEGHILNQWARKFPEHIGVEIGCYVGFSSWFIASAGMRLAIIDPILSDPEIRFSTADSLNSFRVTMIGLPSPQAVIELGHMLRNDRVSFVFIDGLHYAPHPELDAITAQYLCADDAVILFHDAISPAVISAIRMLQNNGWSVKAYDTSMWLVACYRGNVTPVEHIPDTKIVELPVPQQLKGFYSR